MVERKPPPLRRIEITLSPATLDALEAMWRRLLHGETQAPSAAPTPPARKRKSAEMPPSDQWSEFRLQLLRERYSTAEPVESILNALNALPGPPLQRTDLYVTAFKMQMSRPSPDDTVPPMPEQPAIAYKPTAEAFQVGVDQPATWRQIRAWAAKNSPRVAAGSLSAINAAREWAGLKPFRVIRELPLTERAKLDGTGRPSAT